MFKNISDYMGKRYGHLTVIGLSESNSKNSCCNHFDFKCDCGRIISLQPYLVTSGIRTSCGKCQFRKKESKPRFDINEYIGKKSNMLTVIGIAERLPEDNKWYLKCRCDCGNTTRILPYQFKNGSIKSCGCLKKNSPARIDGRTSNPLYGTWFQMISRCENPNDKKYYRYGARGIKVCPEWHDFKNFSTWSDSVGGRPEGFTIDRIDNDGDYCPKNCRWASSTTQSLNKSSNKLINYNGETKTLKEWSDSTGIDYHVLQHRFYRNWDTERALTQPVQNHLKIK